jgi:hypothetical protein
MRIIDKLKRLRLRSLNRSEQTPADDRPLENTDAMSVHSGAPALGGGSEMVPPNYVKAYDEGRPRK